MHPNPDHPESPAPQKTIRQLEVVFQKIPEIIPVYLFSRPGENDVFVEAARKAMGYFTRMTGRIILHELDLSHAQAEKWKISHSPTLLIAPEKYGIRWLGAPVGEEGRILLEALIYVGFRQTGMSDASRKVLDQIKDRRDIKMFVSPSCPYCPTQATNALKAAVEAPDRVSLEIIDIQAFPDIAREYDAQSVPQTYANELLVALGAQPEELFMLSLQKMEQQTLFIPDNDAEEVETDLVIVGGGPAGLSAGIYAARSGLKTVVLERNILGGQVATTPVVENYPGLTQIGGKKLVEILVSHALEYVQIFQGEEVQDVTQGDPLIITTNRRRFTARAMLLATGAVHKHLNVPGESRLSGRGVSYCTTCDGPLFAGQKVVMVGGGDSAVTEALHLKNIGVEVTVVHWTDRLDAQEALARQLRDSGIPILYNTVVTQINGEKSVESVTVRNTQTEKTQTIDCAGVFIAVGYIPSVDLAEKIGVEKTPQGYIKQETYRTSVPGIYAAGDVVGGFNQIVTASGHGAEAALTIFRDLLNKPGKQSLPPQR